MKHIFSLLLLCMLSLGDVFCTLMASFADDVGEVLTAPKTREFLQELRGCKKEIEEMCMNKFNMTIDIDLSDDSDENSRYVFSVLDTI